jgi:hypothetical protein
MNRLLYTVLIVCSALQIFGQQEKNIRKGKISFVSSQNIYVQFPSTENIRQGDTLFIRRDNNLIPVLIVDQMSSISCICKVIGQPSLKVSDEIVASISETKKVPQTETPVAADATVATLESKQATQAGSKPVAKNEQLVQGRLSLASYSNLSNISGIGNTRFRYTLQLNVGNTKKSKLSAESYIQYTHNTNSFPQSTNSIFDNLKIYNLAVKYRSENGLNIAVGRSMNTKVSNLGAIDGLQMEINPSNFFVGAMAGYRPDYMDYSFNSNLFEYGAYFGHKYHSDIGNVQSTLAFFQQNNQGKTDRRFAYFQHDNSLIKDLNLFISGEVDLYKIENGIPMNTLSLTSLYISLRYRINRQLSLFGSYDERKNIIYYQTFKNRGDSIFDAATLQGMQLRVNYRPGNIIFVGLSGGYQFRTKDLKSTENASAFITFNKVPLINGIATLTTNLLRTGYLDGKIFGIRLNKDLVSGKINTGLGYQYVDYNFSTSNTGLTEHIANLDFSWLINRKLSFSVYCEKTFEKPVSNTRIYANLIKRF